MGIHKYLEIMTVVMMIFATCVSSYDRPLPRDSVYIAPVEGQDVEQVHISLVGSDRMRVSWLTPKEKDVPAVVVYGTSSGKYDGSANGTTSSYQYTFMYKSGQIYEAVIGPLEPNTVYYYKCGGPDSAREFTLKTPPSHFPITFAVSGDLGQTEWTKTTLDHISKSNYDVLILPGDLSYADFVQPLWDSFGRLVEPLASQRPWMVTQGNHEVEKVPVIHSEPFTAYNHRWRMPFEESGSSSNLYYSFNVAGVHFIMLGSYTEFHSESEQYKWLENDVKKIDRKATPWVVAVVHAPWYNSNMAHRGEAESDDMKASMEGLLYNARVDFVFTGHVHAYERFDRVYQDKHDKCGPMHITIGDGGNKEGLASEYDEPQPEISLYRQASFGHGILEVVNATHAQWKWQRNDDDVAVLGDSVWVTSLSSDPSCAI